MKVKNMISSRTGRAIANQFILYDDSDEASYSEYFQSYKSIIVRKKWRRGELTVYLDEQYWDYSRTTSRYRNQFLGETTRETQAKINSGEYVLVDLN